MGDRPLVARPLVALGTGALALALALPLAGCAVPPSTNPVEEEGSVEASDETDAFVSTALVVRFGENDEQVLFVDRDTDAPYYPTLPDGAPELASGNVVRVTGNGIMLESYPAQYPGITKVEVIEEGSPADAAAYDELVAQLWQEPDPGEPPSGSVEYATDLSSVCVMLPAHGYTWTFEEGGETRTVVADVAGPAQVAAEDLPDVAVSAPTEVRASFSAKASSAEVTRLSEDEIANAIEAAGSPQAVPTDAVTSEPVACEVTDGSVSLTVEPGWRYALTVEFEGGTVGYLFTVRAPS